VPMVEIYSISSIAPMVLGEMMIVSHSLTVGVVVLSDNPCCHSVPMTLILVLALTHLLAVAIILYVHAWVK
jgi:hypothetical protein